MDRVFAEVNGPARDGARLNMSAVLIQSAFCALPMIAIIIAASAR
jgi:hypothetical protein